MIRNQVLSGDQAPEFRILETPVKDNATRVVDEWQGKRRLSAAGIEVPAGQICRVDAIDEIIDDLQYPLVLKAVSAGLPHKSEAGAVVVDLQNAEQLRGAFETMQLSVARKVPEVVIEQVMFESMIEDVIAELMIGINTDSQFGQMLVIASGGVLVELVRDAKTLLLPTSNARIRNALQDLKCFKLLQGFRGRPAADIEQVVSSIRALVDFAAAHHCSLVEMDINPLMVTRDRCIAVDVMIRELDSQV